MMFSLQRSVFCRRGMIALAPLFLLVGCGDPPGVSAPTVRRSVDQPRSLEPDLVRLLEYYDPLYDPGGGMLQVEFRSPGYHSRLATGTPVHPTRESLFYALALLQRDDAGDRQRAALIVRNVVALQDQVEGSDTLGVWPWLLEEPLAEMDPPDLNWADFCGAQLAHMLIAHGDQLPAALQSDMRTSLRLAAEEIRRRDVGPGYTNIAVLGGGVCAAAGETLGDEELLAYGRRRLAGVAEHTALHGSFSEYNSPPYLKVVIAECERTLQLVRDEPARRSAEAIRQIAWQIVAEGFHPPTGQLAGPHSRSSRDRLRRSTVDFLARRVGAAIATHPTMEHEEPRGYAVVRPISCPAELLPRFVAAASPEQQDSTRLWRRRFERGRTAETDIVGVTWFQRDACLGSVSRSSLWTQRKPIIGYWRTDEDPAVVFRLRFLHDDRDFASMGLRAAQADQRVLVLLAPLPGMGDWHTRLDRPADGRFTAVDFRLRLELSGRDARVEERGEGRFALVAGDYQLVVHTTPSLFADQAVRWETEVATDRCAVDGVCYRGPERAFVWSEVATQLAVGLELLPTSDAPVSHPPRWEMTPEGPARLVWDLPEKEALSLPAETLPGREDGAR